LFQDTFLFIKSLKHSITFHLIFQIFCDIFNEIHKIEPNYSKRSVFKFDKALTKMVEINKKT